MVRVIIFFGEALSTVVRTSNYLPPDGYINLSSYSIALKCTSSPVS